MERRVTPPTSIDGILITGLRQITDERGAVLHHMRSDAPDFTSFGECYFSEMIPGAVKAWKRHRKQTQNLAVPIGRVRFVVYDGRRSSPTNGELQIVELGRPDDYNRLRIPKDLWYGFTCLSDTPALIANCADLPHDPDDAELLPEDDPGIPYRW